MTSCNSCTFWGPGRPETTYHRAPELKRPQIAGLPNPGPSLRATLDVKAQAVEAGSCRASSD